MDTLTGILVLDGSRALDRAQVGGKAWAINHMRRLGLPVPPAFTLDTAVCRETLRTGSLPASARTALADGVAYLEREVHRRFGSADRPLLVSVRSGAVRSMPGMMDTVLNVGCTPQVLRGIAAEGSLALSLDVGERLHAQFSKIVGSPLPMDPMDQLADAAAAVFRSWESPRAVRYREHYGLAHDTGTAVTVQAMVFGNLDDRSGTGVLFTRNPLTGEPVPWGEWLPRAQGEDVVSGRVSPLPLTALAESMPTIHQELLAAAALLEREGRDVQDVEFTVQSGRLWLLQTRSAKRSAEAAVRWAVAMAREGLITRDEALTRITHRDVTSMLRPRVAAGAAAAATIVASGVPGCPGVGRGRVVRSADDAVELADEGVDAVLATETTEPDDVHGMMASVAIATELGGATSHAAVVSRELGVPAVVGCGAGSLLDLVGRDVTVDGGAGLVYLGLLEVAEAATEDDADLIEITRWLSVDTIHDIPAAVAGRARQERTT